MNDTSTISFVLSILTDAAVKSAAVLLLAWAATLAMRRASAAARHLVWLAAMVVALALPIASPLLPTYRLAVLKPTPLEPVRPLRIAGPITSPLTPADQAAQDSSTDDALIVPSPPPRLLPLAGKEMPAIRRPRSTSPAILSESAEPPLGVQAIFLSLWATGALLLLLWWMLGLAAAWRLTRRCAVITNGVAFDTMQSLRIDLNLRRAVTLRTGDIATPLASGFLRPTVLLPSAAQSWPIEQLRSVLLHELAHVQRFDCATQSLAQLVTAVYWFNPLAWLAAARLRVERERACDDRVLSHGESPATYAEHLVMIASMLKGRSMPNVAAIGMARPAGLRRRVGEILDERRDRRLVSGRFSVGLVLAAAAMLSLSSVRLAARQTTPVPIQQPPAPATQPLAAAPALPPLPDIVPKDRFAIRVLSPAGTPMAIDEVMSLEVNRWEMGPQPKILSRFADGWIYVDAQMLAPGAQPAARVTITFRCGGNKLHAEDVFPVNDQRISFQSIGEVKEISIDYSVGPVAKPNEIAGMVLGPAGRPVAGATVRAVVPPAHAMHLNLQSVAATTDARGVFRFVQGSRRSLFYEVRADGYAPRWLTGLEAGTPFTVHLFNDTRLRGKLTLPDGRPAAGATLDMTTAKYAAGVSFMPLNGLTVQTTADAAGAYDVPLEPGVYDIRITSPAGDVARHTDFFLASGAVSALPPELKHAPTLTLRALNSLDGKPVQGASFALQRSVPGYAWSIDGTVRTTDANGYLHWDSMVPGPTEIAVGAKGFGGWWIDPPGLESWYSAENPGKDALTVNLQPEGSNFTVMLQPAATIDGLVLTPDGKPMDNAIVDVAHLSTGDSRYSKQTDAQGKFELSFESRSPASASTSQPANRYAIVAYDPARHWANGLSETFAATPGKRQTVTMLMQVGGRVRGRVVDASGKPVKQIEVEAVASDDADRGYYNPRTLTDSAGKFDLGPMRPAKYTLYADTNFGVNIAPTATAYPQPITIEQTESRDLGDFIYTGPPPGPVPDYYTHLFPDALAKKL